ncbi:SCO family protein [Alkalimarinus sediminis]|uniref:SCO family protein n=1 Tax=Alkalimarinus sediminis TaxID=1632866 RepID=A0A9E8HLN3_9ALTE|nr:SCO family protein [Alkalimarinus sediminis]UZW76397.1 SCO family protein [Alkalimarinus sediminis]
MKFKVIVIVLLFAIVGAGVWSGSKLFSNQETDPSRMKADFLRGGNFVMSSGGSKFELADLKGKVVLLYFGFTSCPDVCPTGLSVIKSAMTKLGERANDIQVLFISLDPGRDDESRLKAYLPFFDERIVGLSGTSGELAAATKLYGVYYKKVKSDSSSFGYTIDHSANYFVIDSEGQLVYVLDHSVDSDKLAETILKTH